VCKCSVIPEIDKIEAVFFQGKLFSCVFRLEPFAFDVDGVFGTDFVAAEASDAVFVVDEDAAGVVFVLGEDLGGA